MMRSHKLVRTTLLIGLLAGALWLSRSIAAAEQPAAAAPNPKSAAGAAASHQGALFTAFVPVLRHPRCMNCHSNGDFPRHSGEMQYLSSRPQSCWRTPASRRTELGVAAEHSDDLAGLDRLADLPVDQGSQAEQEPEHRATRRASYGR